MGGSEIDKAYILLQTKAVLVTLIRKCFNEKGDGSPCSGLPAKGELLPACHLSAMEECCAAWFKTSYGQGFVTH